MGTPESQEERASVPMTVRSVRLPDALWKALIEGVQQANVGRKRRIVLAELIRGLLERGLNDPKAFEEIGSKVVRPARLLTPVLPDAGRASEKKELEPETPIIAESPTDKIAATVAERLRQAREKTELSAGKIVNQICELYDIPEDARTRVRQELYNAALGDPLMAPLGLLAIEAAKKWLDQRETHR